MVRGAIEAFPLLPTNVEPFTPCRWRWKSADSTRCSIFDCIRNYVPVRQPVFETQRNRCHHTVLHFEIVGLNSKLLLRLDRSLTSTLPRVHHQMCTDLDCLAGPPLASCAGNATIQSVGKRLSRLISVSDLSLYISTAYAFHLSARGRDSPEPILRT